MGKGLNIVTAGQNVSMADGGIRLSKRMHIDDVEEHESFKTMFRIDPETLESITKSMTESGFDGSTPLQIWKTEGHRYLIDGYTRYTACKKAGIKLVPVYEHEFENLDAAYRYALKLQVNRRNLSASELMEHVSRLLGTHEIQTMKGDKATVIAQELGVSRRTALRAMSVEKQADDDLKKQIEDGTRTVNEVYKMVRRKAKDDEPDKKPEQKAARLNRAAVRISGFIFEKVNEGKSVEEICKDNDFRKLLENPLSKDVPSVSVSSLKEAGIDLED